MLEDIANPFSQVAKRPARAAHPAGPRSAPGAIPSPAAGLLDGPGPVEGEPRAESSPAAIRIVAAPGPGEVAPPRWWAGPRAGE